MGSGVSWSLQEHNDMSNIIINLHFCGCHLDCYLRQKVNLDNAICSCCNSAIAAHANTNPSPRLVCDDDGMMCSNCAVCSTCADTNPLQFTYFLLSHFYRFSKVTIIGLKW